MKNFKGIGDLYGLLKLVQDVISVILPAVEMMMKRDLNGNGKVGE